MLCKPLITWLLVDLPLWKMMEFVSWDSEIPNWMESHNPFMFQTTKQDISLTIINHYSPPSWLFQTTNQQSINRSTNQPIKSLQGPSSQVLKEPSSPSPGVTVDWSISLCGSWGSWPLEIDRIYRGIREDLSTSSLRSAYRIILSYWDRH